MDPLTHSLVGAALSRASLRRTPLATPTLVVAANVADVDIFAYVQGEYAALAFRRGVTHGPLGLLLLPLFVVGAALAWDALRRRHRQDVAAARAAPLLALAYLGAATHPLLDWLNTYGIRLLAPFSPRWFYGDAVFIIDPWLWLLLGGALALYARSRGELMLWLALAIATSAAVLLAPQVPLPAKLIWGGVIATLAGIVIVRRRDAGAQPARRLAARLATVAAALYISGMIASDKLSRAQTLRAAQAAGMVVVDLMVAPAPANPLAATIVAVTHDGYQRGTFSWTRRARVRWLGPPIPHGPHDDAVAAAARLREVQQFLTWSRFPFTQLQHDAAGDIVTFSDARYPRMSGSLGGVTVRVRGGAAQRAR